MSLIKKQQKKSSPSAAKNVEAARTSLPESSRTRLWELFGLIEKEFETIHSENTVRKYDNQGPGGFLCFNTYKERGSLAYMAHIIIYIARLQCLHVSRRTYHVMSLHSQ